VVATKRVPNRIYLSSLPKQFFDLCDCLRDWLCLRKVNQFNCVMFTPRRDCWIENKDVVAVLESGVAHCSNVAAIDVTVYTRHYKEDFWRLV